MIFTTSLVTKFLLQGFDENGNGMLDGLEVVNWFETFKYGIARLSSACNEFITFVKRAWNDSEMDGDKKTGTKTKLIQFYLRLLNTDPCE